MNSTETILNCLDEKSYRSVKYVMTRSGLGKRIVVEILCELTDDGDLEREYFSHDYCAGNKPMYGYRKVKG